MNQGHETYEIVESAAMKTCCANAYQSNLARLLLGDSFHPGGVKLTEHLGTLLSLRPGQRILDIASGQGTSAITLARCFGCQVLGIEYGYDAVQRATQAAEAAGVSHLVSFQQGDAERLPIAGSTFDTVLCECAFCTFPDKPTAAKEFVRVLKPGGHLGFSDLTRMGKVPEELQGLLAWIACIADAQPKEEYVRYLTEAELTIEVVEAHDEALSEMVQQIRGKLLGAELLTRLKKIELPLAIDFEYAKALMKSVSAAIQARQFGYVVITAGKSV
jgi:ubiquinone/menaquinone biosynthesis C-methylase UbiE